MTLLYNREPRLAITLGLPKSGKSTFCKYLLTTNSWAIISPDMLRLALHGSPYIQSAESFVWATAELAVLSMLQGGLWVIVDATNTTRKRRKQWLDIARDFDITLEVFEMDTPYEECRARNSASAIPVPEIVMQRMMEQYESVSDEEINSGIHVVTVKGH